MGSDLFLGLSQFSQRQFDELLHRFARLRQPQAASVPVEQGFTRHEFKLAERLMDRRLTDAKRCGTSLFLAGVQQREKRLNVPIAHRGCQPAFLPRRTCHRVCRRTDLVPIKLRKQVQCPPDTMNKELSKGSRPHTACRALENLERDG